MSDAAFQVLPLDDGLAELRFDLPGESVNKFSAAALASLKTAVEELRAQQELARRPDHERQGRLLRRRRHHRVPGALQEERGRAHRLDPRDRCGVLRPRGPGRAVRGRHQRSRRRRRLRAVPDGELSRHRAVGAGGPPRGEARAVPRLGRDRAPVAAVRRRHRDRVDRGRRAVVGDRRAQGRSGGRGGGTRRSARGRARHAARRGGRHARLEGPPRREDGSAEAERDRGGNGVRHFQGLRSGQGRPALPRRARGDRGDRAGRGQGPRRGARDRGQRLREDRQDEHGARAGERLPGRSGR